MKNFQKILLITGFSLGFAAAVQAQTANATLSANATVVDQLVVTQVSNLGFGIVMQGVNKMIKKDGTVAAASGVPSVSGTSLGKFRVNAGAGSSLTLNLAAPSFLSPGIGDDSLPIEFNKNEAGEEAETVGYGADDTANFTSFPINTPTSITIPTNDLNGKNGIFVFVGGVVKPAGNQKNGVYSGTVTLTATYN